jgi:hypothetical protein
MVSMLVDRVFEPRSGKSKDYENWYWLLLREARSIKEKEQRLVDSESG